MNDASDVTKELTKRIAAARLTLKSLDLFWLHSSCPIKFKILVADAVIRSKVLYGLESAHVEDSDIKILEVFQLKVLRKILKMKTTFVDRANTNQKVFETANRKIREGTDMKKKTKLVLKFGRSYRNSKLKRLAKIVRADDADLQKTLLSHED